MTLFGKRRLKPPSTLVFLVSLILAALAVASIFYPIPTIGHFFRQHGFWVLAVSYALLAAGVLLRRL
ncbi:MAG: hypothetical protein EPN75_10710 [Beijerinckiaceae bacterium]|nr:MAG: hypothetical protein EPN75_10710 [Beijerinckiaceae bacterium]